MATDSYIKESRRPWYNGQADKPTTEQLYLGCFQRIADATEKMAEDHDRLTKQNKRLRESNAQLLAETAFLRRRLAATQGVVTKLKNKQEEADDA